MPADSAKNRDLIAAQADQLAELLGIDPDDVMFDRHGVSLSPKQAETVINRLRAVKHRG